jgi:hypothetical protein
MKYSRLNTLFSPSILQLWKVITGFGNSGIMIGLIGQLV